MYSQLTLNKSFNLAVSVLPSLFLMMASHRASNDSAAPTGREAANTAIRNIPAFRTSIFFILKMRNDVVAKFRALDLLRLRHHPREIVGDALRGDRSIQSLEDHVRHFVPS